MELPEPPVSLIPGGIGALTLVYFFLRTIYNFYFHPLSRIPGPPAWSASHIPLAWSIFQGTSVKKMGLLHRKYGPVLRLAPDAVCFAQPEAWSQILHPPPGRPETILKDTQWFYLPGMAKSLSQEVEPKAHARMKRALQPAFTTGAIRAAEPFIQRYVNLLVGRLGEVASDSLTRSEQAEVDIVSWANFTAFDIFGDLGLGESFGFLENKEYHPWVNITFHNLKAVALMRAISYFPLVESLLNLCIPPSIKKMQKDHVDFVRERVHRRLNYEFERDDIMSHIYTFKDNDNGTGEKNGPDSVGVDSKLDETTDKKTRGLDMETITAAFWEMVMAGSETTATTMSGTINHLVQNPDKLKILENEVRSRFGGSKERSATISLQDVQDLTYLNAVLKEGLRLCPAFPWILPRLIPAEGATICGAWLPGGTKVSIHIPGMNQNPAHFYKADSFLPERWLPQASTDPNSPFFNDRRDAFQPFNVGPRVCLSRNLAWAEIRLILAKLVCSFDLGLPADESKRVIWNNLRSYIVWEKPPIGITLKAC